MPPFPSGESAKLFARVVPCSTATPSLVIAGSMPCGKKYTSFLSSPK